MNGIAIKHSLAKGDFRLDVDTVIPAAGITGVFGESGSGKTSLLRCIAGLDGCEKSSIPVHQRRIGYVFQDSALFPHLTVRKNIEYGMRRNPQADVPVDNVVQLLELDQLLHRSVEDLSGGEAQRVSIARALCQAPKLILMDEPLSSLDERRRSDVLPYLDRLHAETSVPIVYVSHNMDEICRLSDYLLVLDDGRIAAEGELQDVLARIDVPQIAGDNAGAVVDVSGHRFDEEYGLTAFEFSGGELTVPGRYSEHTSRLRIRAGDVSLTREKPDSSSILNILPANIIAIAADSNATELVQLKLGDDKLVARITRRSRQQLGLRVGEPIFAQIKSVTVRS